MQPRRKIGFSTLDFRTNSEGNMPSSKKVSDLLHMLYAAPTQPELWQDFLQEFSKAVNLTGAAILHQDLERGEYNAEFAFGVAAEGAPSYQRYYGTLDAWRPGFLEKAEGEFALGSDLCALDHLKTTEFYNDFLVKHDLRLYGAVATVKRPRQVELVTLYQSWNSRAPAKEAVSLISLTVPHIRRALQLRRSFVDLRAQRASLEVALDLLPAGIVFLDDKGSILLMNRSAKQFVKAGDLQVRTSRLATSLRSETVRLGTLIDSVVGKAKDKVHGGSFLLSRKSSRPITLILASLGGLSSPVTPRAAAVIFIYDPDKPVQLPLHLLQHGYHLTTAESRLSLLLVEGHSLKDAADLSGVTFNTARSQLKAIFAKTGVQRQGELLRLLLGNSMAIRP
jgi:DNA-binding CsgD family transcriptional regulator/PAS domain-containing protein